MFLSWWRRRRLRKLAAQPFPERWEAILLENVDHYVRMSDERRAAIRRYVRLFVAERHWEGCNGLEMTDEVRVTISALVGTMMLGYPDVLFDHVPSILVYPTAYRVKNRRPTGGGAEIVGSQAREGEAWYRGPVILSWADVLEAAHGRGVPHNLVVHEFAHQLDMLDGADVDGMPPQPTVAARRRWEEVLAKELAALRRAVDRGRPWLDPYGATEPAEFFAVASEAFFEAPSDLRELRPELFSLLHDFYRVDPAEWLDGDRQDESI
ncbi:MAG TPA: zinc-dependent peptidase [Pirellulaceae bacterium]|nr:zinc-dependent peptidase [Pirellulaceae bacterium]